MEHSVETVYKTYITALNEGDLESVRSCLTPVFSMNYKSNISLISYEQHDKMYQDLVTSGWGYTEIEAMRVLDVSKVGAVLEVVFTRYSMAKVSLQTIKAYYSFENSDNKWRINGVMAV